jgi:hypothetical protein
MRTAGTAIVFLALLASQSPSWVAAQESPGVITPAEHRCQDAFGNALVTFSNGTGACLVDCETNPGRRCSLSFPDAITGDCLSRALAAAQVPVLRNCAGSDCPECYGGGTNCASYANSAFSQEAGVLSQAIATLYCDDSSSADGLTRAEQSCQRGLARASGRFFATLQRCFRNCQKAVQRGTTGFSSCESAFLDTPTFDPRTQRCIDRARAVLLDGCQNHCADPPDCFPYSCSETALLVETEALAAEPATYCSDSICGDGVISGGEVCDPFASPTGCPVGEYCFGNCTTCGSECFDGILAPNEVCDPTASPNGCPAGETCIDCFECVQPAVCGDGQITPPEACDQSAVPTGCPPGYSCNNCEFCRIECGDGVLEPDEVCDPSVSGSCGSGSTCTQNCEACIPVTSATEDLTTCEPPVTDQWTFQVTAGQTVLVHADTIDAATAADLCFQGTCTDGTSFYGDDEVSCTFPPPAYACPETSFVASSDATCTMNVMTCSPSCADPSTARYRLDVTGSDLVLVEDDVPSSSLAGAFVRAPLRKGK